MDKGKRKECKHTECLSNFTVGLLTMEARIYVEIENNSDWMYNVYGGTNWEDIMKRERRIYLEINN